MDSSEGPRARTAPDWRWPDGVPQDAGVEPNPEPRSSSIAGSSMPSGTSTGTSAGAHARTSSHEEPSTGTSRQRRRHWLPRQCRICLDTVQPTTHIPSEHIPGFLQQAPKVTYEDENGRLLRPCMCKGSSKYVHEGCLQAWRYADPSNDRNYWTCPTCGFKYRLARMGWANWIAGRAAQITLTILILLSAVFLLGFVADPIINLYVDPLGTFSIFSSSPSDYYDGDGPASWTEHFVKGFAGLGVVGFLKVLLASPFSYFRFGGTRRRGRATGRDRVEQVSWIVIAIGVATVLGAIYKGVRAWSHRALKSARERVMDVQHDEDDDDDEEAEK